MKQVRVIAPAKINLSLDIVGRRPDGYHTVSMVMQAVSLYDTLTVAVDEGERSDAVSITCEGYDIPCDKTNIVSKAATAFYQYTQVEPHPLTVVIEKEIPTRAGLAGGSADGAATVLALNYLYETHLTMKEMADICAKVGSDVPFCLLGGTMLATGTGTTLKKLCALQPCHIVICKPDLSVSTKEAYEKCDSKPYKGFLYTDEVVKQLYRRDIRGMSSCLYNEFEQVLTLPEISEIKKQMMKHKALGASMSGSGSAVYAIFLSEKRAQECVDALKKKYDKVFLCEPVKDGAKIE
ncbi:MAG: 4-(cytidine 5'-diphospho)-2-C-methyl-D-erythritol kinase [Ruminococcus sp.]|nr:4-(cytidine 5'-diphospho)-2-C-methyl-D-erythritol kinase [Ruminococcus sp.]